MKLFLLIFHFPKESRKSIHLYYYSSPKGHQPQPASPYHHHNHHYLISITTLCWELSVESKHLSQSHSITFTIASTFRTFCGKIQSQHSDFALKLKMDLKRCTQKRTLLVHLSIHSSWLNPRPRSGDREASKSIDLVDQIKSITVKTAVTVAD